MAILDKVFRAAVKDFKASDVHIVPGEPIMVRCLSKMIKLKSSKLTPENTRRVIYEVLTGEQQQIIEEDLQLDFAIERRGVGRFRGSSMLHSKGLSAVFRVIPPEIPTLADLGLPEVVTKVLDNHQGLILVTGATGHGKSTTMAAMVDYINSSRAHHILTIEDPIEFVHSLKKGVVNQRQLGTNTLSYANALKGALRQDPDVIMVGELRDLETISMAISAAETGHLVISTLATSSGPKTVERIINSYPHSEQSQIRAMLSEALKAVITQRLIPSIDGSRMLLAAEILLGTMSVGNMIRDNKTFQLPSVMQTGRSIGMQLMDDSIMELLKEEKISAEIALANAADEKLFRPFLAVDESQEEQEAVEMA